MGGGSRSTAGQGAGTAGPGTSGRAQLGRAGAGTAGSRGAGTGRPLAVPPGRATELRRHGPALWTLRFCGMELALLELCMEVPADSGISGNADIVYKIRQTVKKGTSCTS